MKRSYFILIGTILSAVIFWTCGKGQDTRITTGTLFEEMIDLQGLAKYPEPAFRMRQFSSYDHRSQLPGGRDWYANADGFGNEPIPNFEKVLKEPDDSGIGEYLIADVKGPGAVVRVWTALIRGRVRLYIDNAENPVYDGDANDFFHKPYDRFPQMDNVNRERFQETIRQRDASYAPIPFAQRLRVVWIGNLKDTHFYQMQVRQYPEETPLKSFSPEDIAVYSKVIDNVTLALSDPENQLPSKPKARTQPFSVTLEPKQQKEALFLPGPGAVAELTLQLKAKDRDKALRQTLLFIKCDDSPWGQVQSPVGDFFGAAPGVNPYHSLPFSVKPDGTMLCRYVMPYADGLRIQFANQGTQEAEITGSVQSIPFSWDERSMHFYGLWRTRHNLVADPEAVQDLPFLVAVGKGVYVGSVSFILNPNTLPTPWGNWWGEGDEKVFVDKDTKPSLFGTGSEDYYNYSWSSPDIFFYPFCGQPRNDGPGNRGFVTNFRWHILDPIPFQENIRFYLELFSHERTPGVSYARIGYHYARPGITNDHQPISEEDVRPLQLPEIWNPEPRFGARDSVFFAAEEIITTSKKNTSLSQGRLWAGGQLLVWSPQKEGERIDFKLQVASAGPKRLFLTAALTPTSGQLTAYLNHKPLKSGDEAAVIDLYRPYRTLLRNFSFNILELEAGAHTLTLAYKGARPSIMKPEIGIDFIWIQDSKR